MHNGAVTPPTEMKEGPIIIRVEAAHYVGVQQAVDHSRGSAT
jgi:hypothetical protein